MEVLVTDNLHWYCQEIKKYPIMSDEEEFELAVKVKEYNDFESAKKLILSNLRYVVSIAYKFKPFLSSDCKLMDIIQEGNIGLMTAVKKFDPYRRRRLVLYAHDWIKTYIQKYLFNNKTMIKAITTQTHLKLFYNMEKMKTKMIQEKGEIDWSELATKLGVKVSDVIDMEHRLSTEYINTDLIEIEDERGNQETQLDKQEALKKFYDVLGTLDEREKYIIEQTYLVEDKKLLREIAEELGITRQRVCQLLERTLKKLKGDLNGFDKVVFD
jgi:RNA polymerase sigma-32 factor